MVDAIPDFGVFFLKVGEDVRPEKGGEMEGMSLVEIVMNYFFDFVNVRRQKQIFFNVQQINPKLERNLEMIFVESRQLFAVVGIKNVVRKMDQHLVVTDLHLAVKMVMVKNELKERRL